MTWRIDALHADGDATETRIPEHPTVNRVARLSARWHTVPDAFVARPITEGQATGEMSRILIDRDPMLIAEQLLDGEVERVAVSRRAQGDNAMKAERWLSSGLGVVSKSRLMRGVTHDVKNPIGAVDGYLQLLEDGIFGSIVETQRTGIVRARH